MRRRPLRGERRQGLHYVRLDESVQYARDRAAFGRLPMAFQVTRHKLADARSRLAAARALVHETTVRVLRGALAAGRCAMTKNVATDMAVQIHGGMGYMREGVVERLYWMRGCTQSAAAPVRS